MRYLLTVSSLGSMALQQHSGNLKTPVSRPLVLIGCMPIRLNRLVSTTIWFEQVVRGGLLWAKLASCATGAASEPVALCSNKWLVPGAASGGGWTVDEVSVLISNSNSFIHR